MAIKTITTILTGDPGFIAFHEIIANIRSLGRKAALALLGIAVGCMAVVALLNIGHNAQIESMSAFKGMGSDLLIVSVQMPIGSNSDTPSSSVALDTDKFHEDFPNFTAISPLVFTNMEIHTKGIVANASILGSNTEFPQILDLRLSEGRFLSRYDNHSTYAVLGANLANEFQNNGINIEIGSFVQINDYLFKIIGITQPAGTNPFIPVSVDDAILLPIESMRRIVPFPKIGSLLLRNPNDTTPVQTASRAKNWIESNMPGLEIDVQVPQLLLDNMAKQSRLFSWLLAALGGIALLVGGIGVMNVMVMSVSERRREIGVRMALGARPKDIAKLFLQEAIALTGAGASVGALLGLFASWAFVHYSGWSSFSLSQVALPLGIGSAVVMGLISGLSPAMAAARLHPVQALRDA